MGERKKKERELPDFTVKEKSMSIPLKQIGITLETIHQLQPADIVGAILIGRRQSYKVFRLRAPTGLISPLPCLNQSCVFCRRMDPGLYHFIAQSSKTTVQSSALNCMELTAIITHFSYLLQSNNPINSNHKSDSW